VEFFGNETDRIKKQFFDDLGNDRYRFKKEYSTERGLLNVAASEKKEIKTGLLQLMQNVILLPDEFDKNKFYFKFGMNKTLSYQQLDDNHKKVLWDLYEEYWQKKQEDLWRYTALMRLPVMINSTKMLVCGEDLGMMADCVRPTMHDLGILGLRVQRMPADPKREFAHPSEYETDPVATPSTHDTATLRGWWEEDYNLSQRFYNSILGEAGPAPKYLSPQVAEKIIYQHLWGQSMLAVFLITDWFAIDEKYIKNRDPKSERINNPAIPEHYWRYRVHVSIEELLDDNAFSQKVRKMVKDTGRYT